MTEHDDRIAPPAAAALPADAPMFSHAAWVRILPFAAYLFFIVAGDVLERLGVAGRACAGSIPPRSQPSRCCWRCSGASTANSVLSAFLPRKR
jgi:hypothetical protein